MRLTTSRFFASPSLVAATLLCLALVPATASAQPDNFEAAPIEYSKSTPDNAIARLQKRLDSGKAALQYEDHFGYLRSLLAELDVSQKSQTLVFSKTSLQRQRISPDAPRSLYFNDDVYIGMCQGGDVLEISVADPKLGTVFYTLDQLEAERPKFVRQTDNCTLCHASSHTQGVPGHTIRSVFTDRQGLPLLAAGSYRIDQTSPIEKRWGGWYVTGTHGSQRHLGNVVYRGTSDPVPTGEPDEGLNLAQLGDRFDPTGFLTPHSDIVALMVLEHQTEAHNLITRANFGTRQALHYEAELNRELKEPAGKRWDSTTSRIKSVCEPLVRYLLMVDEAPLTAPLVGTSGFAEQFATLGPRDKQGRSLRELDLKTRMFRYPLSYLIYSESFAALPQEARDYVFRRLHQVLWEEEGGEAIFKHLTTADRRAIREILLATHDGLPNDWRQSTSRK